MMHKVQVRVLEVSISVNVNRSNYVRSKVPLYALAAP